MNWRSENLEDLVEMLLGQLVNTKGVNIILQKLEKNRLLAKHFKAKALARTKEDVRQFNQRRKSLDNSAQQEDITFKYMAKALLRVKQSTSEKTFAMFYSVYFEENTMERVSFHFGGDSARACREVMGKLAIQLYPELMIQYMINR